MLTLEMSIPIVGRMSVSFRIVLCRLPDIPVTVRVVLGLARLLEPLMLVTCMIHYEIKHKFHASLVELVLKDVNV
jgi:hypothetical protein